MVSNGSTQAIFSPVSATLQALAVAVGGFRGLILLSIAAGAVVLAAAMKLVPLYLAPYVLIAVGIGGPLWFYSVSGWEHAPAVALGTAAFACALRSSRHSPVAAGLLIGAGATLRDEVLLLAPGLLAVLWLRTRRVRPLGAAVAGIAVPLVLAAAIEVFWFDRPLAAHLRHAVHLLQTALHVSDVPNPDVPSLRPFTLRERYETVVWYWLLGYGNDRAIVGFVLAFLAALAMRWRWRTSSGILLWLCGIAWIAAVDLHEVVTAPKWLAGLLRVSPFVVFAFLPLPRGPGERTWLHGAIAFTAVAYLALAFAGVDTNGGKSLGPRLLLPVLPLLAATAVMAIAAYAQSVDPIDRWTGRLGITLVVVAVVIHLGGTIPAYYGRNQEDAAAVRAAAASPERVVVADDPFTAQLLFPLYYNKIIFLADSPDAGRRLGARLAEQRIGGALLVSRRPEPITALTPLGLRQSELQGRMVVQHWTR
jgi:hypothetical protein